MADAGDFAGTRSLSGKWIWVTDARLLFPSIAVASLANRANDKFALNQYFQKLQKLRQLPSAVEPPQKGGSGGVAEAGLEKGRLFLPDIR